MLDVDMPDIDGITALPLLLEKKRDLVVIMASTLTRRNAEVSLRALALGAADYIPKPATTREITDLGRVPPRADREDPRRWASRGRAATAAAPHSGKPASADRPARGRRSRGSPSPGASCRRAGAPAITLRPFPADVAARPAGRQLRPAGRRRSTPRRQAQRDRSIRRRF